jgi:Protein of unknown function (DUF2934)
MAEERDMEERIREGAFHIWIQEGRPEGRDKEHWELAKAQIAAEERQPADQGEKAPIPGPFENLR